MSIKPWLILAAVLLGRGAFGQEFKVGAQVQDFPISDLQGRAATFSSLKGTTTVVAFIATRCPVSNAYNDRMESLFKNYSAKGVKFIFLNANTNEPPSEVAEHARSHGFTFPVYKDLDSQAADRFGAQFTPELYIIDSAGMVRYHGSIDDSQNPARVHSQPLGAALDAVLAGKAVPSSETKAFGCSIKRPRRGA